VPLRVHLVGFEELVLAYNSVVWMRLFTYVAGTEFQTLDALHILHD
jgi:hypothetical protein